MESKKIRRRYRSGLVRFCARYMSSQSSIMMVLLASKCMPKGEKQSKSRFQLAGERYEVVPRGKIGLVPSINRLGSRREKSGEVGILTGTPTNNIKPSPTTSSLNEELNCQPCLIRITILAPVNGNMYVRNTVFIMAYLCTDIG